MLQNPLKSEAVAFRWLITIALGAAVAAIAATVISRTVGAAVALFLLLVGVAYIIRGLRGRDVREIEITRGGDGVHRLLLLANQTVRSPSLRAEAVTSTEARRAEILVVVPALPGSRAELWASDTDEAAELARQRMELAVLDLAEDGRKARGVVGDSDPMMALEDALAEFPADEILVSTLPPEKSRWLDADLVERIRREVSLPVRHLVWDPEAHNPSR